MILFQDVNTRNPKVLVSRDFGLEEICFFSSFNLYDKRIKWMNMKDVGKMERRLSILKCLVFEGTEGIVEK